MLRPRLSRFRFGHVLIAGFLALGQPSTVRAGEADDAYIALRTRATAAVTAMQKDSSSDEALFMRDEQARADLRKQMMTLLGPVSFRGLDKNPAFSPGALYGGAVESGQPDGLLFRDESDSTRIFVSTVPVLMNWLGERARAAGRRPPTQFSPVLENERFYTLATGSEAAFTTYMRLPLKGVEGETVVAALGLYAQDDPTDMPPGAIIVARISKDRVTVGSTTAPEAAREIPTCTRIWRDFEAKANRLLTGAPASGGAEDAGWDQARATLREGAMAYRQCYASEAPKQSFFAVVRSRADGLLMKMRGN